MKNSQEKILVIGGAGFIGSHLVDLLLKKNYSIIVADIIIQPKSFFSVENLEKKVIYTSLDIRNQKKVSNVIKKYCPDYIIHLAAEPIVTNSYENPIQTFQTNIMGTAYILEEARKSDFVKGIIVASSDKAYGKTKSAYTESSPLHGDHPYDVSKSATDLISQTYFKTYGLPVAITRFGNVYGEGDIHFDRIIPGICKSIITKIPLEIRSDGTYVRDYLYVKDVANGYLTLLDNFEQCKGDAYNFSSQDTFSVLKLIQEIEKIMNIKISYNIQNTVKNEIPYQHLDDTKIRKLHWKTEYTLATIFPKILSWYKKIL